MDQSQAPAAESAPTTDAVTPAEIDAYQVRNALRGIVTVADGRHSPAAVIRALAHLIAEDAMERRAIDDVRETFGDLQALADKIERVGK